MLKDYLKLSQLFSELDEQSLTEISMAASLKKISKGEIIFYDGDPAIAFFIVGSGKVKVYKLSSEGKEQILMIASPGDSFAEAALFGEKIYPASAECIEDSEVIMFHGDKFIGVLGRNPNLAFAMIARLSELLRKLTKLVEGLALTDVTTRLAHYLVEKIEESENEKMTLTLTEKKSILASLLGTIPETLSRSFYKLTKEKVIEVNRSNIQILDYERLIEISNQG